MNFILKQILIVGAVFGIILWFQEQDDKKNKRIRSSYFDKYRLPVLVASIVGFIINLSGLIQPCVETQANITIVEHKIPNCTELELKPNTIVKPIAPANIIGSQPDDLTNISWLKTKMNLPEISDQQVYTDLPDF